MKTTTKYSPEFRERAVRMVFDHQGEHESQWKAIVSIATKIGCTGVGTAGGARPGKASRPVEFGT